MMTTLHIAMVYGKPTLMIRPWPDSWAIDILHAQCQIFHIQPKNAEPRESRLTFQAGSNLAECFDRYGNTAMFTKAELVEALDKATVGWAFLLPKTGGAFMVNADHLKTVLCQMG